MSRIDAASVTFGVTTFSAALLLFLLEPLFVKMALPRLGGSSEVWTACVLFYQIVLLAGYGYAHVIRRLRRVRDQALVHGGLTLVACATLPLALPIAWHPASSAAAVPWLLGALLATVGAPFFVLSATSPLLQSWYALARPGRNPYPLYAASNVGSLVALVLYPFAIEPLWGLRAQSVGWALGYGTFAFLLGSCALVARGATVGMHQSRSDDVAITLLRRGRWVAWAFIPSSLLLSVTTFLSERVAPIPLLWTLPLGIYLASFVVVFAGRATRPIAFANTYTPLAVLPLVYILCLHGALPIGMEIVLHLVVFSGIALVCHGAIARDRPDAAHLTEFYLFVALGGVCGGVFNSLIAPLIFPDVFEYSIVLVLACFALAPRAESKRKVNPHLDYLLPLVLCVVVGGVLFALRALPVDGQALYVRLIFGAAAVSVFAFVARPLRFGLGIAALLALSALRSGAGADLHIERNFYGVKRVIAIGATVHALEHGRTLHGAEDLALGRERVPLTYYSREGPLGDIFRSMPGARPAVAIVGLGAGSTACYRKPGASWSFYEIDPGVVAIARDPQLFRYLHDCAPSSPIVVGDGRLSLGSTPRAAFDLIVLDAYASDAIPTHLLTREAMRLYATRLRAHGRIAFHISNSYFDFAPLIAALAADSGMIARVRFDPGDGAVRPYASASVWVLVAGNQTDLGRLRGDARWTVPPRAARVWTDDYSSIITALRGHGRTVLFRDAAGPDAGAQRRLR